VDELPNQTAVTNDGQFALETLQGLSGLLQEAHQTISDPYAFSMVLNKLIRLIESDFQQLTQMQITAEEKAEIIRLQAQIAEMERVLQMRAGILSGFSQYLKTLIDGQYTAP